MPKHLANKLATQYGVAPRACIMHVGHTLRDLIAQVLSSDACSVVVAMISHIKAEAITQRSCASRTYIYLICREERKRHATSSLG